MGCDWPVMVDETCYPEWTDATDDQKAEATSWASEILDALTGRRYGACPVVVRPCVSRCRPGRYRTFPVELQGTGGTWVPILYDGVWSNCVCGGECRCQARTEIRLPGPVAAVTSVTINGAALDEAAYRVDDGSLLVRQDGDDWPRCPDMDAPATFEVAYQRGIEVPTAGKVAAGSLAGEYLKMKCGADDCRLPAGVTQITRQGVEMTIEDTRLAMDDGLTGIQLVDMWIRAVNPNGLRRQVSVYSPDLDQPGRQTTWPVAL